jgi:hypothetical protein
MVSPRGGNPVLRLECFVFPDGMGYLLSPGSGNCHPEQHGDEYFGTLLNEIRLPVHSAGKL